MRAEFLAWQLAEVTAGKRVYLDNVDIHTVAGLLKAYFRENSEVVCPDHLYPQLLACVEPGKGWISLVEYHFQTYDCRR